MQARFDDRVAGRSLAFGEPREVLVAWTPAEVPELLERVDACGCWAFGYVGYEAAAAWGLPVHPPEPGLPVAWFGLGEAPQEVAPPPASSFSVGWQADWTDADYDASIETVRAHIAAGDTYQVNLTSRLRAPGVDVESLYAAMVARQRTPYAALLDTGTQHIASASPELFFRWAEGRVAMRPMKGTAPRGATAAADAELRAALLASPKERAENVIVTDLLRNDLGRIAVTGSVRVEELCRVEEYETVWQLTSSLSGDYDGSLAGLFAALFPCGSVTGAPKQRTMEVIRDLEPSPRGVYCGAIGWVAPARSAVRAQFSVAIRTAVATAAGAVYGVGGGITWDSVAAAERAELQAKSVILAPEPRLLETFARTPAGFRNLAGHLDRLRDAAAALGYAYDRAAVLAAVRAVRRPARVRVTLARDGAVEVTATDLPASGPVRLAVDTEPTAAPAVKTTDRRVYDLARARHPAADDVVLVNARGEVTETTVANLAARIGGRWWTPPLDAGLLPGVERARLLAAGVLAERRLTPADLRSAEALAVVSSLRGWREAHLA